MASSHFRGVASGVRQWSSTGDMEHEQMSVASATKMTGLRESAMAAFTRWWDGLEREHEAIPVPMQGSVHHGFQFWLEEVTYETKN